MVMEAKKGGGYVYYAYGRPFYMPPTKVQQLPEPPQCIGGTIYTVRPGDTMFRIANEYGISLQVLIAANPQVANPNIIYPGQKICIPIEVTPPPPEPFCVGGTVYTAKKGDSLYSIARRYGITLQRMIAANPQIPDPNVIEVGQQICIPPLEEFPLPEGICSVTLIPQQEGIGILGGTAFVNIPEGILWIATFGLPAPADLNPNLTNYRAWMVDLDKGMYYSIRLKVSDSPDIETGYGNMAGSFEGFDEIIVTAEPSPAPASPSGPVLLRGIIPC